ncbi:hypothetical protein [Natronosalvus amylolyticus]|uniref:hypothetical protein n=1 Tax=Natronosalvus amylolyticus TaxID=2961994 RepID=UPI0020C98B66|nr:hypothetical protein [Natronosalvus amylolyticus]
MKNLGELFGIGATAAVSLFMLFYLMRLQAADGPAEAIDVFAHTLVVLVFVWVPTSPLGAIISIVAGLVGAAITLDKAKPALLVVGFGFCYTVTNIVINWFTIST